MSKNRLEAFSDGVLAVIITIMVLELKAPHSPDLAGLLALVPIFICYVISFIYVGIYWNNHHHMMQLVHKVNGSVLWSNLHLLFWLSLIPFVSSWMSENPMAPIPVAAYGFVLLASGFAYSLLVVSLTRLHTLNPELKRALGAGHKEKVSVILYMMAIPLAFFSVYVSFAIYAGVAAMWFIPDRRIERSL